MHVLDDAADEGVRLVSIAEQAGLKVRLLGGVAVRIHCDPSILQFRTGGKDIDMVTRRQDRRAVAAFLVAEGYAADKQYNAINGHRQMYFVDGQRERPVDVLVDRLVMCHTLELTQRLTLDAPTLPPADLLLTKLQVFELTHKDLVDIAALLARFEVSSGQRAGVIDLGRLEQVTSRDWGWWRTVSGSLAAVRKFVESSSISLPQPEAVIERIARIEVALAAAPKSARWRLRQRLGERIRWYDLPEEVDHD